MNGDCSSATARATFSAPSNTGSPVVFMKSASTIVSCSVNLPLPPLRGRNGDTTATIATSEAMAAAIIQKRPAEAAPAAGCTASSAAMSAADDGRSTGSGDSACITTRSSRGSTPSTMVDGGGK
jgi:hypothetical protein